MRSGGRRVAAADGPGTPGQRGPCSGRKGGSVVRRADDAEEQAYDATPFLPGRRAGLPSLRKAAAVCRGCPLHEGATQTVFGKGDRSARVLIVGEQPGDQEDRQGQPFVGPAGKLLWRALEEAGLDAKDIYVTNAVKHFKFTTPEGHKRRIHKAPSLREMTACKPWLSAELKVVAPEVVVLLGSTAGRALLGPSFRVTEQRGALLRWPAHLAPSGTGAEGLVATIHPSAVLRAEDRDSAYQGLVADLRVVVEVLKGAPDGYSAPGPPRTKSRPET
ncbi:UdgX family uracil-DNA binding protein [Streptomyces wuyuanensis]|uniref:UdgX family uracil-DNA binding protein n=1 Tax=Streptomyces wuyuanensis TaxID=1196353 RepID=UPI003719DF3B